MTGLRLCLPGNNSYFYWSTGLSFILTQAFDIPKEILTFGKLRGSVATVGNDAPFDSLYDGLNLSSTYLGMHYYMTDNIRKNPNLKPEQTTLMKSGPIFASGITVSLWILPTIGKVRPIRS